ncbi:Spc98 family-domain-containing protein [Leucosporidium creatinivorum]|uniref:Spc98 family-domain-containing protein n=1 Tax=Leucosporidium creatinivorum TaxID=106004 RepID=A0A1Y2G0Y9_9BASI|nr:Spc98 family-domain-containing protein [Leucosporidium creatinivorum]
MAALLAQHRAKRQAAAAAEPSTSTLPPVPEPLLLRDIIYVLQGIDGQFVRFKPPPERVPGPRRTYKRGEIVVDGEEGQEPEELQLEDGIEFVLEGTGYSLPAPTRVLLHTLAELGWLYRKIDAKINLDSEAERRGRSVGMVEQSLHAALKGEMTEYYRLVAILEGQLDEGEDASEGGVGGGVEGMEGGLTLRRLMVWTEEVKLRMRMMGTLVEEAGDHNVGGALLTSLHSHTSNGDPFIRDFSSRLLKTLSVPFFATLSSWIYEGELRDPFAEFFVELNPAIEAGERWGDRALGEIGDFGGPGDEEEGVKAHELWEGKFGFKKEMLPGFLEESFGRKIFSTGKSLNFMKYSCQDSAWVVERNRKEGSNRTLQYADMIGLERSISLAYSIASQRLFDIFFDRFRLMDHLKALKDYLMLGKGDFVEILMESLGPSLDRPANLLYRHNLTATLETALRGSTSASDHPDTLRRLDARMLEFTQGEIGWDVFTLEYKVDAPLDTVLDPKSMQGYLKMFKHLWQIKRVEYSLNGVQRRLMTGARTFLRVEELAYDFHHTRISLQQMIFFIRQLQYYCHLEVIGCSWQVLEEFAFKKEGDLDSLIEAHRTYLERLVTKALLMSSRKSSRRETVSMLEQVRKIFRTMLQYRGAVDSLCNYALAEASRQESVRDIGRGIDSPILPSRFDSPNPSELAGIRDRLEEYSAEFRALAVSLVAQLGQAPDLDMRFLAVRLNFNYHFSRVIEEYTSNDFEGSVMFV